ncbi:hypothetical protein [Actinobacillus equuli]|uniref:hypothetical protein n=1 Tax=Actinobacillus equuli TaxID=718 RepID=UPI00244101ED|nr:hypothetical protein [Actinobacillus equuli]WGE47308.1 hypothetical protein NYR84_03700 [Actinobacillus equuli subsp. haemolyticus]WGE51530.1 hypothetical protein NYR68_03870 [Actinobacillus equuli subsp. haemolyticus]
MFKNKLAKGAVVVGTLALAGAANAANYADIAATVDLSGAKEAILAIAVAIGGFTAVGIGVKAVLGMMKRL